MDWSDVTRRVVVEAAAPHPEDRVFVIGDDWALVEAITPRVGRVEVRSVREAPPGLGGVVGSMGPLLPITVPAGTSVVVMHDALRTLVPADQRRLLVALGRQLPPRALLVVGDVMWSMPPEMVDEPGQFGEGVADAPTVADVERWLREAGFLPDTHRFGVGRAVCIALRA